MSIQEVVPTPILPAHRRVVRRTRGRGRGPITRLMSPSDLGGVVKPFVFLDLFAADAGFAGGMGLHPHSGIATITVLTEGELRFDDPQAGTGTIGYGGVEWMRAGGGVWHGKEMSAGSTPTVQGFQLWMALPPELENGPVDSQYVEAAAMPRVGPAVVILGEHGGVRSPVRSPWDATYLLVTLQPGERWTYAPPDTHDVAWLAVARGGLTAGEPIAAGEMAVFEAGNAPITLTAAAGSPAVFVLASGRRHAHDLVLGSYSVHTSELALARGEAKIVELGERLRASGAFERKGPVPIFR